MSDTKNNFDFLRLLFASFVIITHSYALSGNKECDLLCQYTNGQVSFSYLGVRGFFVISGYLVFQSLKRSRNIFDYSIKRILRLYPALILMLILTILFVPFVYESAIPYFKNKSILTYILNNITLYRPQHTITGVFETNPYRSAVNGSLWTIPYEVVMYIFLALFFVVRKNTYFLKILLGFFFLATYIVNVLFVENIKKYGFFFGDEYIYDLSCFFIMGALLDAFKIDKLARRKTLLVLLALVSFIFIFFNCFLYVLYITLPLFIIVFGLMSVPYINNLKSKIGDISYGVYLYAFPVQQTVMYYFKLSTIELMVTSMFISYLLGWFSWHFIEKKALAYK